MIPIKKDDPDGAGSDSSMARRGTFFNRKNRPHPGSGVGIAILLAFFHKFDL
jgi:hypothetical protein